MGMTDQASGAPQDAPDTDTGLVVDRQFVTFEVAGEMFAVPMAPVQEIIRVPEVARMPLAPPALDGLANLRGRVLPIVNLRRLFQIAERDQDDATRALVINLGQPLGFLVDRVASVISVEPGEVEPARSIQSVVQADYLTGVINRGGSDGQRELLLVLDFERLIEAQFRQAIQQDRGSEAGQGERLAQGSAEAGAATADELRLVSFLTHGQEYAIDIAAVQEIVQVPADITELPNTPAHVMGLMSLRQRLLPLVSLRSLFGMQEAGRSEQQRVVVVGLVGGGQVGLVTDTVKEVLSVPRSQADGVPEVLARGQSLEEFESICRLENGKRLVSILAADRLLGLQALRDAVDAVEGKQAGDAQHKDFEMNAVNAPHRETTDDDAQVVIFRLGAEEFGVPIMSVQEIVRVPEMLTRVPKTPRFVEGVINLRGTVLPVIDQRRRLGMETLERNDRQRIMVYTLAGQRTGFIVDSVAEVLRIGRQHIEPSPELCEDQGRLITQVAKLDGDKRLVMLIDPSQLLGARELMDVGQMDGDEDANPAGDDLPLARAA